MAKIHFHTKRIFFPILVVISLVSILYNFGSFNRKYDIKERLVLQHSIRRNLELNKNNYYFSTNGSSHLACIQPSLRDKENSRLIDNGLYSQKYDHITCNEENDWISIYNYIATITEETKLKHGEVHCTFTELLFSSDDVTKIGTSYQSYSTFDLVRSDFYKVSCTAKDGAMWESTIAGIRNNQTLKSSTKWEEIAKEAIAVNVVLLGFDSLSRINFMRTLPKSYQYLSKDLKSYILEGYNIVGDGTPQALIPMLTGKNELELPETRRRMGKIAQNVDVFPFIWKDFKRNGFVTLFAEDQPEYGTFSYRLKGFKNPPTDHYMRPFFNYASPFSSHPKLCMRGTPRHKVFLNYVQNFLKSYENLPKFAFAFHSELSHDDYNLITVADNDILELLQSVDATNTVLLVFSDHGNRFASVRETQQGKQEERLPFMSIYLPPNFKTLFPSAADNIRMNKDRLTTPFDIYFTLKDLTRFSGAKLGKTSERGISLFSQVPPSRTCWDAYIEPHWCACLTWEPIMPSDDKAVEAANALMHYINSHTASLRSYCHEVELVTIHWAALLLPNKGLLRFRESMDVDGFLPDLSGGTTITEEVVQVSISTHPSKPFFKTSAEMPNYDATLTYNVKRDTFSVKMEDVSRINSYGDQPHCIISTYPDMRKFCYCLHAPPFYQ